jgi:hypothetical protein
MNLFFLVAWGLVVVTFVLVFLYTYGTKSNAPAVGAVLAIIWLCWGGFAAFIAIIVYGLAMWIDPLILKGPT